MGSMTSVVVGRESLGDILLHSLVGARADPVSTWSSSELL